MNIQHILTLPSPLPATKSIIACSLNTQVSVHEYSRDSFIGHWLEVLPHGRLAFGRRPLFTQQLALGAVYQLKTASMPTLQQRFGQLQHLTTEHIIHMIYTIYQLVNNWLHWFGFNIYWALGWHGRWCTTQNANIKSQMGYDSRR